MNTAHKQFFCGFFSAWPRLLWVPAALLLAFTPTVHSQSRNLRTQRIVLDDGSGHLLTLQTGSLTGSGTYTFPLPGAGLFQSDVTGTISLTAPGTSGNILVSNGTAWQSQAQAPITSVGTVTSGVWHGTTIEAAYGGTGQTSFADGELLIGNSATGGLTKSTLTAGSNVNILNANGSITISVTASGGGVVGSVIGTANRITAVNNSGDVTVDIASGYAGQTSITTLGTIGTGTWHGSTIGAAYGGTGQSAYTAGDILYASSSSALSKLSIGSSNKVLGTDGGTPAWTYNGATITNTTITSGSLSGQQDDYAIDASSTYFRLNNSSGSTINLTGLSNTGVVNGRNVTLVNVGADAIVIKHQSGGSTAGNKFDLPGAGDIILAPKGTATFIYDQTLGFWELVSTN